MDRSLCATGTIDEWAMWLADELRASLALGETQPLVY
jgi:hypothetical protein